MEARRARVMHRRAALPPVRDYLYISDSKVDMLFDQIPRPLAQRISAELKFDLKLISVSLRDARGERTRYAKLAVVEAYIRRHLPVGSVDDPTPYVGGTLSMRWGPYGDGHKMVVFAGASERTVVGLGGSFVHVLGAVPHATQSRRSAAPLLYHALAEGGQLRDQLWDSTAAAHPGRAPGAEQGWPQLLVAAARGLAPPTQRLEFLARVIGRADHRVKGRDAVVLGSPLYVASADPCH
jgi:hypothetical protein